MSCTGLQVVWVLRRNAESFADIFADERNFAAACRLMEQVKSCDNAARRANIAIDNSPPSPPLSINHDDDDESIAGG